MYYVYIIQSRVDGSYYKGYSENPLQRLEQHNNKESKYTSNKTPWQLVGLIIFETKREALIAEKKMKKYGKERIESFLSSQRNQLDSWKRSA